MLLIVDITENESQYYYLDTTIFNSKLANDAHFTSKLLTAKIDHVFESASLVI